MRKLLLTTAMILPLGLGTALAQDATTPATDMPAATEPIATDSTAAMPADTTMEATDDMADADDAAIKADMVASDMVVQQQAANELRIEWITDAAVKSPDGTNIGDINDLIVDGETGSMIAAVIGVGGFLGIGEKQIAVPFDQLTINYDAQEITSELTKEEATAAPEYQFREQQAAPGTMATDATAPMPADGTAVDGTMAPAAGTTMPADGTAMPADGTAPMPADGSMETPAATDAPAPAN